MDVKFVTNGRNAGQPPVLYRIDILYSVFHCTVMMDTLLYNLLLSKPLEKRFVLLLLLRNEFVLP